MNTNSFIASANDRTKPDVRSPDDEVDLLSVLSSIWRGRVIIALISGVVALAAAFYVFRMATPVYTATALVALNTREAQQVADIESVISGLSTDQATINTELEIMMSRTLGARLVDALSLEADPEFNPAIRESTDTDVRSVVRTLVVRLVGAEDEPEAEPSPVAQREDVVTRTLAAMSARNMRDSYVFRISATTKSPDKSAQLANALAEIYINDQLQLKFDATEQAAGWLSDRVAELRQDLETSEEAAKEFNASIDLVSGEALSAINKQLKDMRERLAESEAAVVRDSARVDALETARESGDRGEMLSVAADTILNRISQTVEAGVASPSFDARVDQIVTRAGLELSRAQTQYDALQRSVVGLEDQVEKQSADLVELEQLEREVEANRLIYESFLVRLREITVQQGVQQPDARILSSAIVPSVPSAPRKSKIVLTWLVLGALAGVALVLLNERRRQGFRTARELELWAGVPVLGQIARMPIRRRGQLIDHILDNPTSATAEAARNLRTSLQLSNVDHPPRVVLCTSSLPGEGKSTTSILLAHHFAALGGRVLLVEGDMRRPVMASYVDMSRDQHGLSAVLMGQSDWRDAVVSDARLGIDVIRGDRPTNSAADLFSSQRFRDLLTQLRQAYDYIVIDTPPVLAVSDARVVASLVDAVLYAVHWNKTTRAQLTEGLAEFHKPGLSVTGLVFTHINHKAMRSYGSARGYAGYGYGVGSYYRR